MRAKRQKYAIYTQLLRKSGGDSPFSDFRSTGSPETTRFVIFSVSKVLTVLWSADSPLESSAHP